MTTTTVRNPDDAAHFMHVKPVRQRVKVRRGGEVLAESTAALRIMETGREPYDPVVYIPRGDVSDALEPVPGKSTHCPLKGDASYFAADGEEIAWTYDRPLEGARLIGDYVAFHPDKVAIEQIGTEA
jgi:uncharacterized protein (DUF427 family)